jgi:signal transduction histidine kinase
MFTGSGLLCFALYMLALPAWQVYHTAAGFYSLLAYLSITCSAAVLAEHDPKSNPGRAILHSALIYSAVVNIGRAVRVLFDREIVDAMSTPPILISDLLYMAIFGLLVLAAALTSSRIMFSGIYSTVVIPLAGLAIHGFLYFLIIPQANQASLNAFGLCLSIVGASSIALAGLAWSHLPLEVRTYDFWQMTLGFTLFGISWVPTVIALFMPSLVWSLAFILRAFGLFVLNLAIVSPFLAKLGMRRLRAYAFASVPSLLAFTPVFLTIVLEGLAPDFHYVSMETYYVTHVGTAIMSGVMAFLVSAYNRQRPAMNRYPLIWLYVGWSVAQVVLVVNSALSPVSPFSEKLIPYMLASLLSLILLPLAVKWTKSPLRTGTILIRDRFSVIGVMFLILANLLSLLIQAYLESGIVGLAGSPVGPSFLLSMNVLVMFALVYLALILIVDSRGRVSAEVLSVGFLAVLIVPTILKGNYTDWTSGWWAAEVFLLIAFLFGPAFLGFLYVRELVRAESSQQKATLFADLLVHDISNYHQAILVCLNLLEMEDLPAGLREQSLLDANSELMRADHLIRNVRRLGMVDRLAESSLVPVDVVQSIHEAYQIVARTAAARGLRFSVDKDAGQCFVAANPLLIDVFLNLFYNSVQYAKDELIIELAISALTHEGRSWWEIRVADHSRGIEPERKGRLFERYMAGAHRTGLGLSVVRALVSAFGGTVSVEDRVPNDNSKGTVFVVTLPAARGPATQSPASAML